VSTAYAEAPAPPGPSSRLGRFLPRRDALTRRRREGYALAAPAVLFIVLMTVFPVLYNGWDSVHNLGLTGLLGAPAPFTGLHNYGVVLRDPQFWEAVKISLIYTFGSLAGQFIIGFGLALLFNEDFPFNGLLRSLILLGWVLPPVVSGTIWRWLLDPDYGAYNALLRSIGLGGLTHNWLTDPSTALLGVIVANVWVGVPFNMLLLLVGLKTIDRNLYEAAAIDGASSWQRLWMITVPLMRGVSLAVLMLGLIYTFKGFDLIYTMTQGGPINATTTLPLYGYRLFFGQFELGTGSAATILLMVIPLVVSLAYVYQLRQEPAR
jgi:multiple sugar transport system permease protein